MRKIGRLVPETGAEFHRQSQALIAVASQHPDKTGFRGFRGVVPPGSLFASPRLHTEPEQRPRLSVGQHVFLKEHACQQTLVTK